MRHSTACQGAVRCERERGSLRARGGWGERGRQWLPQNMCLHPTPSWFLARSGRRGAVCQCRKAPGTMVLLTVFSSFSSFPGASQVWIYGQVPYQCINHPSVKLMHMHGVHVCRYVSRYLSQDPRLAGVILQAPVRVAIPLIFQHKKRVLLPTNTHDMSACLPAMCACKQPMWVPGVQQVESACKRR